MAKLDDLKIDAPVPKPRRRASVPWVPWVLLLFAVLVTAWLQREKISQMLATAPEDQPATGVVDEQRAAAVNDNQTVSGPAGSISAAGYIEIIPPGPTIVSGMVAGRVSEVLASPGEFINKGQVVARLDPSALRQRALIMARRVELEQSRLDRLEAGFRAEEISQAQASAAREDAASVHAAADYQRSRELFEQGVISRVELEAKDSQALQAAANLVAAQAQVDLLRSGAREEDIAIAQAQLSSAQAELRQVHWEISQCTIRAAVDGVVLEQYIRPGDWLTPGTDNPRSGAVLSLFDPADVQVWVDVNQRDSDEISLGQPVVLTTDAWPGRQLSGWVKRIMPQANLQKNTVRVKVAIEDPPADLKPELSVKVAFLPAEDIAQQAPAAHKTSEKEN